MDEMTRSKVQLQHITDDKLRQDMFAKRKQGLIKKAMELSVLCDCDVGLIIFGPGSSGPGAGGQRLYQYSSISMDELLERYAAAVAEPHERRKNGELLRHYYELSPDEDGEEAATRNGDGGASTAAATTAAATMAAVDSIILGGGGRRVDDHEGASGLVKRMRMHSPGLGVEPLSGPGAATRPLLKGAAGLSTLEGLVPGGPGGVVGNGVGPLVPPCAAAPLRRVGGPAIPLEGIKAAGFLDKRNYPVSPRSDTAYEEIMAEFDKLTKLRSQRAGSGARQSTPTVFQPVSSSAPAGGVLPFSLAAQQQHLQQFLQQQQQQQQQGGGGKRFKPLSILVPEIQTHPIIPTNLTPLTSAPPAGAAGLSAAAGSSTATAGPRSEALQLGANGLQDPLLHQAKQQQPHPGSPFSSSLQQPQAGGLPPRPPAARLSSGARPPSSLQPQAGTNTLHGSGGFPGPTPSPPGPLSISPSTEAIGPPLSAANGLGDTGALPLPLEDGGSGGAGSSSNAGGGGPFALDRRSGGMLADDGLGSLLGASAFRTSLDGSAANLLTIPSPPPHGAANALFGSLDGGPLSMRNSGQGMLGSLSSLDRGASLGLGGLGMSLESPGGPMGLDTALRGLAPMDVLDWPSMSPRSSTGNSDGPGRADGGGGGGFPDEGEDGTVLDGLIVRGTALSKLAPEALEAAIGPSPDTSSGGGGGTPVSARTRMAMSAFSGPAMASTAATTEARQPEAAASASDHEAQAQPGAPGPEGFASSGREPGAGANGRSGASTSRVGSEAAGRGSMRPGEVGSAPAADRGENAGMATVGSLVLLPELSLNDLGFGGPSSLDAAAAAAVAAVQAERQWEEDGEREGPASEGTLSLEVVGKALVIPSSARTEGVQSLEGG